MHSDEILAVCGVLTIVFSIGAGLIQLTILLSKIKLLEEALKELKMETGSDLKELKADLKSEMEGIKREIIDVRGHIAIQRRSR